MKKLVCILMVCLSFQAIAQKTLSKDYGYKVSAPYRVVDAKSKYYFSKDNGTAMAIKFDDKDVFIQAFNSEKPAMVKVKEYEKFFPKNYDVEDVLEVNNRYYVFYSSWDGDAKKEQLFAQEIDFENAEFTGSAKLLQQVEGKIAGTMVQDGMMSMKVTDKFDIMRSFDKKKILTQYRRKPEVKNDKKSFDIIGLCAFDGSLEKLSLKEVTMPYTERRMNNLDYQIDNKGNLFMLTKVFHDDSNDEKKKKKDTVANYHVELLSIKAGTDKVNISKFENKNKFISGLWMYDTNKDYLIGGGFYNNGIKTESNDSDGVMVFKIDENGKIYDEKFHEIPMDILNAFESSKTKKKNAKKEENGESAKLADMTLRDMKVLEDGSMIVVGEQYKVVARTTTSSSGTRTTYTYLYGDILATKIAANGALSWMRKIPKNQAGARGQGGMSYHYFFANNHHYFAFLDNVKNIELSTEKTPERHRDGQGGYLTSVKIADESGDTKKGSILNAREVEDFKIYQFSVDRIVKTSENSFMFEAYKKSKEDIMIKVTLN